MRPMQYIPVVLFLPPAPILNEYVGHGILVGLSWKEVIPEKSRIQVIRCTAHVTHVSDNFITKLSQYACPYDVLMWRDSDS